ncbi:MAG: magnesium transporter [Spirochaetaceae bacterium]|nr:MAG: magnesium transporter [Spirochaetaceae bacterium]
MLLDPEAIDELHRRLHTALERSDLPAAEAASASLSSSRIAQVLREAAPEQMIPFLFTVERYRAGRILSQLPSEYAARLLLSMERPAAGSLLSVVPVDHAVDIIQKVPSDDRDSLMHSVEQDARREIERLLHYPAGSAGAHMTGRFVAIGRDHTVGQTLTALRSAPPEIERATYVYVTDEHGKPVGVVSIRDLIRFDPSLPLSRVMNPAVVAVSVSDSAVEAAQLLRNRRFTMIPVLDEKGTVAGVITFDDAIDILSNQVADQLARVNAGSADESFFTTPMRAVRLRLPWMALNVFLNLGAVAVITGFEETIAAVAILAAFLPMITDMGGNVGIQSLSVAIRAIALGEVRLRDFWRAIRKELAIGLVNGVVLGSLFSVVAYVWQRDPRIGVIAGFALGINVLVAGVIGGTIPFAIKRLGRDPAMMTGPILTTITDITGVSIYLGLSTLFLLG